MLTNFYLNMNAGFGLSRAFELSFGVTLRTFLINAATYLVLLVILTYALIFAGDMVMAAKATSHEHQAAYVRELERVVDKCTSRGENSIVIDGEVWLCGAVPTGAKI